MAKGINVVNGKKAVFKQNGAAVRGWYKYNDMWYHTDGCGFVTYEGENKPEKVFFVIAGHGAGDSGACGNGYREADLVRRLATAVNKSASGRIMVADMNRDYYADNGISNLDFPVNNTEILELHMDSARGATGGHIIKLAGVSPTKEDYNLEKNVIKKYFPGRPQTIVYRTDLANMKRAKSKGYGYRLMECGFITSKKDVNTFITKMNDIADDIVKSLLGN